MRALSIALMAIGVLTVCSAPPFEWYLSSNRPVAPDVAMGKTYASDIRGKVVYLSQSEALAEMWLFKVGAVLALCGGALFRRSKHHSP